MTRTVTVKRPNAFWWNVSKFAVWCFAKVWFRLRVEGAERFPAGGPVIVVANHTSYLDPPLVGISSPGFLLFLAQAGLRRFPPLRWWLGAVGVTLIDRDAPSKEALRVLADSLRAGHPVGVFPEGTRSKDGSVHPFRNGVEFLVRRTGAPVLPVGIDGAFRAMPRGAWLPRPRKIVVRFGEVWTAAAVLAEGGSDALRRCVAELARSPLSAAGDAAGADASGRSPGDPVLSRSPEPAPSDSAPSEPAAGANQSRTRQSS